MMTAREFSDRLADLLRREHEAMADFLVQARTLEAELRQLLDAAAKRQGEAGT